MILCAGKMETFAFAQPIGIGMVQATINLTKLILMAKPDNLIFVGSCGSFGEHEVGEIITSSCACNIENAVFTHNAYTPIDNLICMENGNVSRETIINSSNYITRDKDLWKHYKQKNIGAENMEFFAIMSLAKEFALPCMGVFVVTNFCDCNAHEDFIKNHKKCMQTLSSYVQKNIVNE